MSVPNLLLVATAATKKQKNGELNLQEEQKLLTNISDMIITADNAGSLLLRVQNLEMQSDPQQHFHKAILRSFFHDAKLRMGQLCMNSIPQLASGDLQKIFVMGVSRFHKYPLQNVIENRRVVAKALIEGDGYCLFK